MERGDCSGERKSAVSFSVHRPHTAHHLSHKIPVSLYPRNNLLSILQNHILSLLLLLNMPCIHNNTLHHRKPMQSLPLQSHPPRKTIPEFLCGNNCERKCMTLCSSFPHRKSPDKSYILFQKPAPDHSWFPAQSLTPNCNFTVCQCTALYGSSAACGRRIPSGIARDSF